MHTDTSLPADSFVNCFNDYKEPKDNPNRAHIPKNRTRGDIAHPVIHIQSPTIRTTYIQAGCSLTESRRQREKGKSRGDSLGAELEWVGMQLKRLGKREMSFEIGIIDSRGREGMVRCSSFKVSAPLVQR